VIAGVGLTVIARTLGIDGMASRAATLAVVVLLLIRAKSAWRRRHAAPPGITGAGQA
jgi:hypothetical protein